jgi:hypothetical protein
MHPMFGRYRRPSDVDRSVAPVHEHRTHSSGHPGSRSQPQRQGGNHERAAVGTPLPHQHRRHHSKHEQEAHHLERGDEQVVGLVADVSAHPVTVTGQSDDGLYRWR